MKALIGLISAVTGVSGIGAWGVTWGTVKNDGLYWLRDSYQIFKQKSSINSALAVQLKKVTFAKAYPNKRKDSKADITIKNCLENDNDSSSDSAKINLNINHLITSPGKNNCQIYTYTRNSNDNSNVWAIFSKSKHEHMSPIVKLSIILANEHLRKDTDTVNKDAFLNHLKNYVEKWNPESNKEHFWFVLNENNNNSSHIKDENEAKKWIKSSATIENSDNIVGLNEFKNIVQKLKKVNNLYQVDVNNIKSSVDNDISATYVKVNKSDSKL